jgi:uncharacterized repeat protein (TIGR01451 family)
MPKKLLPVFLVTLMVFGAVGLGVASANNNNEPNNPMNAVFTKTESASTVEIGDMVTFTVTVSNPNSDNGHNDFTDVTISDAVPNGVKVIDVTGGSFSGNEVSADIGTLKPGESKTITIITKAVKTGKFTNTANLVYTVDQGQKKICCAKKEHANSEELLNDKTLCYNGHNFNANDHKGEVIGSFKSIETNYQNDNNNYQGHQNDQNDNNYSQGHQNDQNDNNYSQGHQNDQNDNNYNQGHQNDQNCNNNNYKWVHCDKVTHKNCDKCCKWVSDPVQRTAQASSDPLVIKAQQTPSSVIKEPNVKAQKETVGMQETGAPLVALLLAGLMLFSGMLMPKLK